MAIRWQKGNSETIINSSDDHTFESNVGLVSDEIDNSSGSYMFDSVELIGNKTEPHEPGDTVYLYIIQQELDGSGYETSTDFNLPADNLVGVFDLNIVQNTVNQILNNIPIPSNKFKYIILNKTRNGIDQVGLRRTPYRYITI